MIGMDPLKEGAYCHQVDFEQPDLSSTLDQVACQAASC